MTPSFTGGHAGAGEGFSPPKDSHSSGRWGRRLRRLGKQVSGHNVGIIAGGLAFYGLLGVFPGLVAVLSIAGFFLDENEVEKQLQFVGDLLPGGAGDLVTSQLTPIAATGRGLLGLGIVIGLGGAVWSLSSAVSSLFAAMQIAYGVKRPRHFLVARAIAVLFAVGALAGGLVVLAGLIMMPSIANWLGLGATGDILLRWGRWPLMVAVVFVACLLIYRFGIRRTRILWKPMAWGALWATGIWVVASIAFAVYIACFANYSQFYGALSTVIILLMYFLLTSFAILMGAEIDFLLEKEREISKTEAAAALPGRVL